MPPTSRSPSTPSAIRRGATARALAAIGSLAALDPAARAALSEGPDFDLDVLLASYRAASVATSREVYERLLGLNASGHGALTRAIRAGYVARNTTDAFQRDSVMTWSDYRRGLRTIFHRVKVGELAASTAAA